MNEWKNKQTLKINKHKQPNIFSYITNSAGPNLVQNGNFETGNLNGWQTTGKKKKQTWMN